jgi:hypothetical protein
MSLERCDVRAKEKRKEMTYRETVEDALDRGHLWMAVGGRWWRCRRNGQTKTWKRDEARWKVPIKAGWKVYDTLTQAIVVTIPGGQFGACPFMITHLDPNKTQRVPTRFEYEVHIKARANESLESARSS